MGVLASLASFQPHLLPSPQKSIRSGSCQPTKTPSPPETTRMTLSRSRQIHRLQTSPPCLRALDLMTYGSQGHDRTIHNRLRNLFWRGWDKASACVERGTQKDLQTTLQPLSLQSASSLRFLSAVWQPKEPALIASATYCHAGQRVGLVDEFRGTGWIATYNLMLVVAVAK